MTTLFAQPYAFAADSGEYQRCPEGDTTGGEFTDPTGSNCGSGITQAQAAAALKAKIYGELGELDARESAWQELRDVSPSDMQASKAGDKTIRDLARLVGEETGDAELDRLLGQSKTLSRRGIDRDESFTKLVNDGEVIRVDQFSMDMLDADTTQALLDYEKARKWELLLASGDLSADADIAETGLRVVGDEHKKYLDLLAPQQVRSAYQATAAGRLPNAVYRELDRLQTTNGDIGDWWGMPVDTPGAPEPVNEWTEVGGYLMPVEVADGPDGGIIEAVMDHPDHQLVADTRLHDTVTSQFSTMTRDVDRSIMFFEASMSTHAVIDGVGGVENLTPQAVFDGGYDRMLMRSLSRMRGSTSDIPTRMRPTPSSSTSFMGEVITARVRAGVPMSTHELNRDTIQPTIVDPMGSAGKMEAENLFANETLIAIDRGGEPLVGISDFERSAVKSSVTARIAERMIAEGGVTVPNLLPEDDLDAVVREQIDAYVRSWAQSSDAPAAQDYQRKVGEMTFNADSLNGMRDRIPRGSTIGPNGVGAAGYDVDENFPELFSQAVYDETQDYLAAQGIYEVEVMRGTSVSNEGRRGSVSRELREQLEVDDRLTEWARDPMRFPDSWEATVDGDSIARKPLTSWTTDPEIARSFSTGKGYSGPASLSLVQTAVVPARNVWSTAVTGPGALFESEVIVMDSPGQTRVEVTPDWDRIDYPWVPLVAWDRVPQYLTDSYSESDLRDFDSDIWRQIREEVGIFA